MCKKILTLASLMVFLATAGIALVPSHPHSPSSSIQAGVKSSWDPLSTSSRTPPVLMRRSVTLEPRNWRRPSLKRVGEARQTSSSPRIRLKSAQVVRSSQPSTKIYPLMQRVQIRANLNHVVVFPASKVKGPNDKSPLNERSAH